MTKKTISLKVEGMHCKSCAMLIDMGLAENPGIVSSKTSYEEGTSDVSFDSARLSEKDIMDAIAKTGYKSEILINLK